MDRTSPTSQSPRASNKRKLSSLSGLSSKRGDFPRKRSATACQLCRSRKTKCDNIRPLCTSCRELGAECIYIDQAPAEPSASQILQRLEYLIGLVEPATGSHEFDSAAPPNGDIHQLPLANASAHLLDPLPRAPSNELSSTIEPASQLVQASLHEYFGSSEDVLTWPIFDGKYDRRWIEALIFDPTLPSDDLTGTPTSPRVHDDSFRNTFQDPRQGQQLNVEICEKDVPLLIDVFLLNVHIKNPIFDPEYLRGMAKNVVERGFDWDAPSCLVLIVCALGAISSPFKYSAIRDNNATEPSENFNSLSTTPGYHLAEEYYVASRKRIGLLKDSLLATECHFMSGIYEMYSLRPLQSAISFNRACVTFQTLTWMRTEYYISESQLGKARASRLYWSCLKSEHEMSIEIRFPSSGLTRLNYTSAFPPPPKASDTEDWYRIHTATDVASPHSVRSVQPQTDFEHGWYYYLADIAARRLLQRVVDVLYRTNEATWLTLPLACLIHTVEELDRQLGEWHRALPSVISFDIETRATEELAYHLQARALEIKERIYRPFLYRLIHAEISLTPEERSIHESLVMKHAIACSQLIQQWNVQHRHHGTWLMSRQSFACALLLLAARRAGILATSAEQFEQSVQSSIATLRFWEREAPDLKAARQMLEDIHQQLHPGVGRPN